MHKGKAVMAGVALILAVMAGAGAAQAQGTASDPECAALFAQYGFEPLDVDAASQQGLLAQDLIDTRLFPGQSCRAASLVLDWDAAATATAVDLDGDITGVYVNENAQLTASGDLPPGFEILDIEHFYAGFIFTQYMIGPASISDVRGAVVFPIRISRLRSRMDEQGWLTHDPRLSRIRYYADPITRERSADLAWKQSLNYWEGRAQLRQGRDGKLVLGFEPRGAQAALFGPAAQGQASLRPTDWESLTITQRMMAAEQVPLRYFPCVLRKVENRFAGESIAWVAALDALAQSEVLAEDERMLQRRLRSAETLGRDTAALMVEQSALEDRRARFERTANGQLFAAFAAQAFGCPDLPSTTDD